MLVRIHLYKKLIYVFNTISMKTEVGFFGRNWQADIFIKTCKGLRIVPKTIVNRYIIVYEHIYDQLLPWNRQE